MLQGTGRERRSGVPFPDHLTSEILKSAPLGPTFRRGPVTTGGKHIDIEDCDIDKKTLQSILNVEKEYWLDDIKSIEELYNKFGDRVPAALVKEVKDMEARLKKIK